MLVVTILRFGTLTLVSDSSGSYGSPLTESDFTFYNGSDAQMMFGGGSGYYANVSYGSYGGSYSNYMAPMIGKIMATKIGTTIGYGSGYGSVFRTNRIRSFMRYGLL